MEYSPTLCFVGFNSKRRKFQQRKKRKRAIATIYVATEFCVSRQTSKQMAKGIDHDNISYVAKKRTEFRKGAMSRQGIICRDKKLKSNTGRILRHINLCCDIMKNRR